VRYSAGGRSEEMPADLLLLHQGVVPNINLANAIGCAQRWDEAQLAFVPTVDDWGASSVDGVAIAGDGAGIAGARAAEARGRLAAMQVAHVLGRLEAAARDHAAAPVRAELARYSRGRAFVDAMYRPADAFRIPTGDTVVCRCEEVTAQQIVDTVKLGCTGPNQMKSFLRCGMGPCQGRLCGLTVTELIARERGVAPGEVGHYRLRFPIKPIPLGELAALPQTDEAIQAVVRIGKAH
jgi:bacterioferritin-associated ferredoxin